jgi:hypothetical protein
LDRNTSFGAIWSKKVKNERNNFVFINEAKLSDGLAVRYQQLDVTDPESIHDLWDFIGCVALPPIDTPRAKRTVSTASKPLSRR